MLCLKLAFAAAISWGLWPPRPPDIKPCDFYFEVYYRKINVLIIIVIVTS